jgi:hypothetical protein
MKTLTAKGFVKLICRGIDSCFVEEEAKKQKDHLAELFMDLTMSRGMEAESILEDHPDDRDFELQTTLSKAIQDSRWLDDLACLFDEETNKKETE